MGFWPLALRCTPRMHLDQMKKFSILWISLDPIYFRVRCWDIYVEITPSTLGRGTSPLQSYPSQPFPSFLQHHSFFSVDQLRCQFPYSAAQSSQISPAHQGSPIKQSKNLKGQGESHLKSNWASGKPIRTIRGIVATYQCQKCHCLRPFFVIFFSLSHHNPTLLARRQSSCSQTSGNSSPLHLILLISPKGSKRDQPSDVTWHNCRFGIEMNPT